METALNVYITIIILEMENMISVLIFVFDA